MRVIKKEILSDGTPIQMEDWSKDYSTIMENSTIAIYPKSKTDIAGYFAPRKGKTFRCAFFFKETKDAEIAYMQLVSGEKKPIDFKEFLEKPQFIECL